MARPFLIELTQSPGLAQASAKAYREKLEKQRTAQLSGRGWTEHLSPAQAERKLFSPTGFQQTGTQLQEGDGQSTPLIIATTIRSQVSSLGVR
jgi:hypothetical protein